VSNERQHGRGGKENLRCRGAPTHSGCKRQGYGRPLAEKQLTTTHLETTIRKERLRPCIALCQINTFSICPYI